MPTVIKKLHQKHGTKCPYTISRDIGLRVRHINLSKILGMYYETYSGIMRSDINRKLDMVDSEDMAELLLVHHVKHAGEPLTIVSHDDFNAKRRELLGQDAKQPLLRLRTLFPRILRKGGETTI